ncbi:MAG: hypothetical protein H0T84_08245 [Tatlockia sp.]|nr:hypothetical protein [Tatlockia sp.]
MNKQQTYLRSQALFLLILCLTILAAQGLLVLLQILPQSPAPDISVLLDTTIVFLKPIERTIFLTLGLAIPLCAFFLTKNRQLFHKIAYPKLTSLALPLVIALLFFWPLVNSPFLALISPIGSTYVLLLNCFVIATLWCLWTVHSKFSIDRPELIRLFVWILVISAMLLLLFAWRIAGLNGATSEGSWSAHIDAVVYPTSQVIAGKTLLVDLPSQYGLFPEMIAPLMRAMKGTILHFSLFFAALQVVSLLGLFFVLSKLVKSSSLLLLGCISLLLVTFLTFLYFQGINDRYYQYFPIRFFWPALSIVMFYFFTLDKNLWRSCLVSATGALGTLWVMDTGLFITLSFAAYLTAKFLTAGSQHENSLMKDEGNYSDSKFYFKAFCLHLACTLLLIAVFLLALWIKAQHPLHLSWLFRYQKIFYGLGFAMLPLPKEVHPWMSILGIYLLGFIISLHSFFQKTKSIRADVIFYLSMLGLGLFIYYEGRAHVYNLVTVSWPALMIMIITADSTLNHIRNKMLTVREIWFPIVTVTFLLICNFYFMVNIPRMFNDAKQKFTTRKFADWPVPTSELAFIKHYSQSKQECLIFSRRQGIYYAETGLASPIKGPGMVETLLKSDLDNVLLPLFNGKIDCLFLGISDENYLGVPLKVLKDKYNVIAENAEHTMLYLTPKDLNG